MDFAGEVRNPQGLSKTSPLDFQLIPHQIIIIATIITIMTDN